MNPAFLDEMSWEMAEVYGAITDQIIINLARLFPYVKVGGKVPESAFTYQAAMLAQMGKVNAQTIQIIRNGLSDADAALANVLETTIAQAIKTAEPELYKGAKKGMLMPPAVPVLSPNQTRAFQLYYSQAANKLNLVNTVMLESTQSAYMQCVSDVVSEFNVLESMNRAQIALDVAAGETITGVSSWNQAVKHATDRLKEGGIVGFIDHGNHRWSAEAYVAMDVRTTVYNTARAAVWEENESFGNDLYIVSYHNGARPGCYDWQNKVISANNVSGETVDLDGNAVHVYAQNETSYGQAAGLFGINCKHYPTPFIPGVSAVRGKVQDKEANDKQYEESQEQRRLERNLREEKRDLEMLKAQGADEDQIRAQRERVRAASDKIDDFCDETGRVRRRNRESVYTKREFPDPDKYDPAAFAKEQQQRFDDYWKNGGTQTGRTFGTMTPNEPLTPNPPPVAPVVPQTPQIAPNVAQQATTSIYNNDMFNGVKGVDDGFRQGMAKTLLASGNQDAINLYGKYANDLYVYDPQGKSGTFFRSIRGGVSMNLQQAARDLGYEKPYEVAFHEFGHMIDWLANGKNNYRYLSNNTINGVRLKEVIKTDYDAFKKSIGAKNVQEVISTLKAENMPSYESANISDILEFCTGKSYPLGSGHGANYHRKHEFQTEKEFFAEVLDSSITNPESYAQMQRLFPNAVKMVWEMIRGVI